MQSVLLPTNLIDDDEVEPGVLLEAVSITRIEDLLDQMKFREVPKRALFSVPLELAENFVIGVKGCVPLLYAYGNAHRFLSLGMVWSRCRRRAPTAILLIWEIGWSL